MQAAIDSMLRLPLASLTDVQQSELRKRFCHRNPEYANAKRMRFPTTVERGAKRDLEPFLNFYTESLDTRVIGFPRAAADDVFRTVGPAEISDRTVVHPPIRSELEVTLRPYQIDALRAATSRRSGVLLMPCGAGKTTVGIAVVDALRQPTIIVVHTRDLMRQWDDRIRDLLFERPGIVGDGRLEWRPITVATVQTLVRLDDLERQMTRFGHLLIDEAHHTPAETFRRVVNASPARYRYGLTATPVRRDGLTQVLYDHLGPVLYEIGAADLIRQGYLVAPRIHRVDTEFKWCYRHYRQWNKLIASMTKDGARNALICGIVRNEAAERGRTVLVLTIRKEHCRTLAKSIRASMGVEAVALTGDATQKKRDAILDRFRAGDLPVVISTQLADEGLDVPRLGAIVMTCPASDSAVVTQRAGRAMRPHPDKGGPADIYDLVDPLVWRESLEGKIDHPLLRKWDRRRTAYRDFYVHELGMSNEEQGDLFGKAG